MNKRASVSCIAIDFDDTLASLEGGKGALLGFFAKSLPFEEVVSVYQEIRVTPEGFSPQRLIEKILEKNPSIHCDKEELLREFAEWLRVSLKLFPEVYEVIEKWRKKVPVVIVSAGNEVFQREKITFTKVPHDACYVTAMGKKTEVIAQLLNIYSSPIAFIDDKRDELQVVKDDKRLVDKVRLVLLDRNKCASISEYFLAESLRDKKLNEVLNLE